MYYTRAKEGMPNAKRLQGIGWVGGTPVSEIKIGNTLMWNFGTKSVVTDITDETAKTLVLHFEDNYKRMLHKTRLVVKLEANKKEER